MVDSEDVSSESGYATTWPVPVTPAIEEAALESDTVEDRTQEESLVDSGDRPLATPPIQETLSDARHEPEGDSSPASSGRFEDFEQRIVGQLEALRGEFQHKIQYDRVKEKQVSELNRELQSYRSDLLANAMRPLINDVIRLHRKIDKRVVALAMTGEPDDATENLIRSLIDIREDLELALGRQGIEVYRVEGDMADSRLQFVIRPVDTANPDLVGRIINRLAPGYRKGERILEKERIEAYRFNAETPVDSGATADASASARGEVENAMTGKGTNA